METNMKHFMMGNEDKVERADIWQIKGYCSTDCGEENDEQDEKDGKKQPEAEEEGDEEYYEYYDEEEEGEGAEAPDLMVVGTGITAGAQEEEKKLDAAQVIAKEKESLKVPEEERKMAEQMSDIEKKIIAKQDKEAKAKQAEKEEKDKDFSWWKFDDP